MNTKMLIATLAASVALSFSASATTTPSTTLTPQVQTTEKARMLVQLLTELDASPTRVVKLHYNVDRAVDVSGRVAAPEFCYVGKMKVACTLTDAPSKDPTGTRP